MKKRTGSTRKTRDRFRNRQTRFRRPFCVTFVERANGGEERWHSIGSVEDIIVLVVVHTYRQDGSDEVIRIISARRATRHERKLYVQANG